MAPAFATVPVTIVRDAGKSSETKFEAKMGGGFDRKVLFHLTDRVRTGDEIHHDYFDEPRVIVRVTPGMTHSGPSHWEAEIMPVSEWKRRNVPSGPIVHVNGQGSRININSIDQSVQNFRNEPPRDSVLEQLEDLRTTIEQLTASPEEKTDARTAVDQIDMEILRSKPDKTLVWRLLDRLNAIGGLVEKAAKLTDALDKSGLFG